jgi:hypothetical protein
MAIVYMLTSLLSTQYTKNPRVSKNEHFFVSDQPKRQIHSKPLKLANIKRGKSYQRYDNPCPHCDKVLKGPNELKHHILAIHEKLKPHICDKCGKSFVRKGKLNEHIKLVHDGVKNHACPTCGIAFGCSQTLKNHVDALHIKVDQWFCDKCEFSANTHQKFLGHVRIKHDGHRSFKCDFVYNDEPCGMKFIATSDLRVIIFYKY